jgi:hypothetical protein
MHVKDSSAPLLIVAHPGHELRVHGWLEKARPVVCVLTDGSGGMGEARIDSTTRLLERVAARKGNVYGVTSDRGFYSAMMNHDLDFFLGIADQLCSTILEEDSDCVIGDAVEGYNPSHDVCRLLINSAVRMADEISGRHISMYDFLLVGLPDDCPLHLRGDALMLSLDDECLNRKLDAAKDYPELASEVESAIKNFGVARFRTECLRPVDIRNWQGWTSDDKPDYETYGERRVAEGVYDRALKFREHVYPIAEALRDCSFRGEMVSRAPVS